jgi:hypothetical protein
MITGTDRQCNESYRPICGVTSDECYKLMKSNWIDNAQKEAGKTNYQNEIKRIYRGARISDLVHSN